MKPSKSGKLVKFPDYRLRQVCQRVVLTGLPDPKLNLLVSNMIAVMFQHGAWGLAAPQVGSNLRVVVINPYAPLRDIAGLIVALNPTVELSGDYTRDVEGCLSIPNVHENVYRPRIAKVEYMTPRGETVRETCDGVIARVWQHEIDHLNGVLITDPHPKRTPEELAALGRH